MTLCVIRSDSQGVATADRVLCPREFTTGTSKGASAAVVDPKFGPPEPAGLSTRLQLDVLIVLI